MKRLALLALALATTFSAAAFGQEYAPLVQKDTVAVTRVNLDNLDAESTPDQLLKIAVSAVDYFCPDKDKAKEIKDAAPLIKVFVTQYLAEFVQPFKTAGVGSFYFIVDQPASGAETLYPYVAIPIGNVDADGVKAIGNKLKVVNQKLNGAIKYRFTRNGFYFIPIIPETVAEDEAKAYVKDHFGKLNKVDKPAFADGFKLIDADSAVISGVALAAKNEELAKSQLAAALEQIKDKAGDNEELSEALEALIKNISDISLKCADLVSSNSWRVSLSNPDIAVRIKANSAADAKQYVGYMRDDLLKELDGFYAKLAEVVSKEKPEEKENVAELVSLLSDAVAVFMQFGTDGDVVTWDLNAKFFEDNKDFFDKVVKTATEKISAAATDDDAE